MSRREPRPCDRCQPSWSSPESCAASTRARGCGRALHLRWRRTAHPQSGGTVSGTGSFSHSLFVEGSSSAAIAQTGIPGGEQAAAYAAFVLIGTIGVAAPVVVYFALGERAAPVLDGLKTWMARNNGSNGPRSWSAGSWASRSSAGRRARARGPADATDGGRAGDLGRRAEARARPACCCSSRRASGAGGRPGATKRRRPEVDERDRPVHAAEAVGAGVVARGGRTRRT